MRENSRPIIIATWIGIVVNILLTILKAIGGLLSGSRALLADALHSASDVVGSVVILFAVKIANKPPDEEHPYGHGKAENIASVIVALLLIIVGIEISISSIKVFFGEVPQAPGKLALIILIASVIIKEILFYYKYWLGNKYKSTALISEAWHHRSDSLSSLAALAGVGLAILGDKLQATFLVYGDAVAGIIVSIIVMKVGYELVKTSSSVILEEVLSKDEIQVYQATVQHVDGVLRIDQLLARTHGSYIIIDIKISVDPNITVKSGHDIALYVKQALIQNHKEVEDVLVHINPYLD
ncbi:cation diffusion facilitator family transporter [Virgibacillus soli]|uniref:Cation diffusion facilitator family transporter n=1 Tax=Paracerasibacillus soli TaxID=480284 RepID=A0ABU5CTH6_9BACI|nr:cation diffusion facilitator family transporter [Virgibacillus soli]MDY0409644.1 cation diffusion facilitator family transporter [Virgibacillus soli]